MIKQSVDDILHKLGKKRKVPIGTNSVDQVLLSVKAMRTKPKRDIVAEITGEIQKANSNIGDISEDLRMTRAVGDSAIDLIKETMMGQHQGMMSQLEEADTRLNAQDGQIVQNVNQLKESVKDQYKSIVKKIKGRASKEEISRLDKKIEEEHAEIYKQHDNIGKEIEGVKRASEERVASVEKQLKSSVTRLETKDGELERLVEDKENALNKSISDLKKDVSKTTAKIGISLGKDIARIEETYKPVTDNHIKEIVSTVLPNDVELKEGKGIKIKKEEQDKSTVYTISSNIKRGSSYPYPAGGGEGNITAVNAGTNLNGGGSSGDVTVNLDAAITDMDSVGFDVLYTPTESEPVGTMYWHEVDGTMNTVLKNGSILQAGQEIHFYGKASGAISNGDPVQFAGVQGDHILMKKAVAAEIDTNPEYFIGVATQNIANGDFGYVTWFGKVNNVYTDTPSNNDDANWVAGDLLYLNMSTGYLTRTEPTAPTRRIVVAAVIKVQTGSSENGIIIVRPTLGMKLSELNDVDGSAPDATGDLLTWNNTLGVWERNSYNITDYTLSTNAILKTPTAISSNTITIPNATYKGLVIKGASSQSVNLTEWQNSGGTVGLAVTGSFVISTDKVGTLGDEAFKFNVTNSASASYLMSFNFENNKIFSVGATSFDTPSLISIRGGGNGIKFNTSNWGGISAYWRLIGSTDDTYRLSIFDDDGTETFSHYIRNTRSGRTVFIGKNAGVVNVQIKGASAQTANLTEWQNSGGTVLAYVEKAGLIKSSGRKKAVAIKTGGYTATTNDEVILFQANDATLTLPAATGSGQHYLVRAKGVTITIDGNGSDTINEELTQVLYAGDSAQIVDEATGAWGIY